MLFGSLTHAGPVNHILDGVKIGRIHSQPRGVTSRRCGLLSDYFGQSCYSLFWHFSVQVSQSVHAIRYDIFSCAQRL